MTTKTTILLLFALVAVTLLAGVLTRPLMTEPFATHWNAQGQADGYGSAFTALYLLPLTILGVGLLVLLLPVLDPLRANVETFRADLNGFVLALALFLAYLHALTLAWNAGMRFDFNQAITPAFGIVIIYTGVLLSKARRNFFIGIRTPWTLSSDVVWDRTHRLGGRLFTAAGVIAMLGVFFPRYAVWLLLVPLLAASLIAVVYSYFAYRQETRRETL